MLEFLEIAAEEVQRADLLGPSKCVLPFSKACVCAGLIWAGGRARLQQSLNDAVPVVVQAVGASIDAALARKYSPQAGAMSAAQLPSALKCLEAWLQVLPAKFVEFFVLPS